MKKALVLGGGFGGVEAAIQLRRHGFQVTLVSNREYIWIYPVSIWIPVGGIEFEDATVPLADLGRKHGFEVLVESVTRIETAQRKVHLAERALEYDYLVLALGSTHLPMGGLEHTLSICGAPAESVEIRDAIAALVQKGGGHIAMGFGGNPKDKSAMRGGPIFELLFNVDHHLRKIGRRDAFTLTFFAPMDKPGQKMGQGALDMMDKMFEKQGIAKLVGRPIDRFEPGKVVFKEGDPLEADLVLFTPGLKGPALLKDSDLPLTDAGFVKADTSCRVEGLSDVFAVGDVASLEGPAWKAKQGHLAEVMGRIAASTIAAHAAGEDAAPETYSDDLCILCLMDTGDGAAYVYRDDEKSKVVPMPVFGHWAKQAWGSYWRHSRLRHIPRLPGM